MERQLVLEDGTIFKGQGFGADAEVIGEVVFSTGMSGYQESITDQSYNGEMLVFTYPLIGNAGINRDDYESITPTCKAVIVKEHARIPSNWRSNMSLDAFLKVKNIPGLAEIDTRKLTRILRSSGTMKGILTDCTVSAEEAAGKMNAAEIPSNQVAQVSTKQAYAIPGTGRNVVVIDFGLKRSILNELVKRNCHITVLPYNTDAKTIFSLNPDGVVLTNGPGDPTSLPDSIKVVQEIQGKVPVFGICLGHQILSLADGAKTYKMKFGHRGFNHPVKDLITGKIAFTSQNHGYAVDGASVDKEKVAITHIELNDGTVEGLQHRVYPSFSVQFHPDAAPGPHDAAALFDRFMGMMDAWKENKNA